MVRKKAKVTPDDYSSVENWLNRSWSTAAVTHKWDGYNGAVTALQMAGFLVVEQRGRHKVMPHADA